MKYLNRTSAIGENTADNRFSSSNVASNRDGSVLERTEVIISDVIAVQSKLKDVQSDLVSIHNAASDIVDIQSMLKDMSSDLVKIDNAASDVFDVQSKLKNIESDLWSVQSYLKANLP